MLITIIVPFTIMAMSSHSRRFSLHIDPRNRVLGTFDRDTQRPAPALEVGLLTGVPGWEMIGSRYVDTSSAYIVNDNVTIHVYIYICVYIYIYIYVGIYI